MIENVFEELKGIGAVTSGSDFSEQWLGMEASYYRGLRAKQRDPSVRALANCAVRLRGRAGILQRSAYPQIRVAAQRYQLLAEQCLNGLLAACDGERSGNEGV